ncbi:MAG: hypothetical protein ACI85K_000253 [Hyphomicrobiaceae bacterium]|jgi:hypothetical protein
MSTISKLWQYSRQRVTFPLFYLLALALVAVGRLDLGVAMQWPTLFDFALAFVLLWQLRLWDDLVDVEKDRASHPERLLVQATNLRPYRLAVIGCVAMSLVWLTLRSSFAAGPAFAPLIYAGFLVLLATWYKVLRPLFASPVPHYHAVLLKYPAFIYVLSPSAAVPWRAMVFAYLAACIYEVIHDRGLKNQRDAWFAAGAEIAVTLTFGLIVLVQEFQT